ncbi:maleylpyruvate isomerase N-terminal domain-containing protein [Arthrobacter sp. ATA002]|uniref:maleylpyruvate isomerase N-terminal domain-containing protein n=1 Tax=Arthrobacter sp. ATA002 TaxID=2991715 RepID=UPI003FA40A00
MVHLARDADALTGRLSAALDGYDSPSRAPQDQQREAAARPADEVITDLSISLSRLEEVFALSSAAGWPQDCRAGEDSRAVAGAAAHRLHEVETHHTDLGLGYTALD